MQKRLPAAADWGRLGQIGTEKRESRQIEAKSVATKQGQPSPAPDSRPIKGGRAGSLAQRPNKGIWAQRLTHARAGASGSAPKPGQPSPAPKQGHPGPAPDSRPNKGGWAQQPSKGSLAQQPNQGSLAQRPNKGSLAQRLTHARAGVVGLSA